MTWNELASHNRWADRLMRGSIHRITIHLLRIEAAIAELMDATFEEQEILWSLGPSKQIGHAPADCVTESSGTNA